MKSQSRALWAGIGLLTTFLVVLVVMFMPIFGEQNALDFMDSLYNSISKGSAYYIGDLADATSPHQGKTFDMPLDFEDPDQAEIVALLLEKNGAGVDPASREPSASGDLGVVLDACLEDADDLFKNNDTRIETKYGRTGREVLYGWWLTLKSLDKELKRQSSFEEAAFVLEIKKKGVECAYNFYGIEPKNISSNFGIVALSLVFYVIYTVWYGYAIILIFEGCGLRLSH